MREDFDKDFELEVYDGTKKIFDGLASKFIEINDEDLDVIACVEACRITGCSTYGGGASADFEFVRKEA